MKFQIKIFIIYLLIKLTLLNSITILKAKTKQDSINLNIEMPSKSYIVLNIPYLDQKAMILQMKNTEDKISIITKKIKRPDLPVVLVYGHINSKRNGNPPIIKNYFILDPSQKEINFKYNGIYLNNKKQNEELTQLFLDYDKLLRLKRLNKTKKNILNLKIKQIFNKYKNSKDKNLRKLNIVLSLNTKDLSSNYNNVKDIFLSFDSSSIYCSAYLQLGSAFIENHMNHMINNSNLYSLEAKALIAFSGISAIKMKTLKPKIEFYNWLLSSNYYKLNKEFVEKTIKPINKQRFKLLISNLVLLDSKENKLNFKNIINGNSHKNYLIDLWATWCKPCIGGINKISKMKLPSSIEVINLSVDKLKDKAIWQKKSKDLIRGKSYLLDSNSKINKEFLKLIKLKSIPRYILIDRKMNLIDEAFLYPHEPNFIDKLRNAKFL